MSRSMAWVTRVAMLLGVCGLVALGAQAGGAKTASKGKRTGGHAFVADTRMVGSKTYAAGDGFDRALGPAALTLVFSAPMPTSQPDVVKAKVKPMTLWLRTGTMVGTAVVFINTKTGAISGNATFRGDTGTLKGHTLLVPSFKGTADLAKGRFHYTYSAIYK